MKYIKLFDTLANARISGGVGFDTPHIDYIEEKDMANIYSSNSTKFNCTFDNSGVIIVTSDQPFSELWYTTTDNQISKIKKEYHDGEEPYWTYYSVGETLNYFGSNLTILSHSYDSANNRCVLKLSGDITTINNIVSPWSEPDYISIFDEDRLTSISIPTSVTSIGTGAFYDCTSLGVVFIPSSLVGGLLTIGDFAFKRCSSLSSISLPSSLTSIGVGAFGGCSSLTSLTLPTNLTTIQIAAFSDSGLTSMVIPNNVTSIGNFAFSGCGSLSSISLPSGLTSIGEYVFVFCESLSSITIPSTTTSIGDHAFYDCPVLTDVTCLSTTPPTIGSETFQETNLGNIYVQAGSVNTYKTATNWSAHASIIKPIPTT